jgi:hypothetical protein
MKIPFTQSELIFQEIKPEPPESRIYKRFEVFHNNNPEVYNNLVALARDCRRNRPNRVIGIQMLFEALRWNYFMNVESQEEYKFPNAFAAGYARLIMKNESDLEGIFKLNKSTFDE